MLQRDSTHEETTGHGRSSDRLRTFDHHQQGPAVASQTATPSGGTSPRSDDPRTRVVPIRRWVSAVDQGLKRGTPDAWRGRASELSKPSNTPPSASGGWSTAGIRLALLCRRSPPSKGVVSLSLRGSVSAWPRNVVALALLLGVGAPGCGDDETSDMTAHGASSGRGTSGTGGAQANGGTADVTMSGSAGATLGGIAADSADETVGVTTGVTGIGGSSTAGPSGTGSAGTAGTSGADGMGGADGGGVGEVAFEPREAVYSVALSVTTTGVTETIGLRNTFGFSVTVSDIVIAGGDGSAFSLEGAPAVPSTISAGDLLELSVRFQPPLNAPTRTFSATLSATSSGEDAGDVTVTAGLYGLAMSMANAEATLDQVLSTLGIVADVGSTTLTLGTGSAPVGDEILVSRFVKANAAQPVRLVAMARYSPMEAANYGYYTGEAASITLHQLGTMSQGPADNVANRTLFPPLDPGAMLEFEPGSEAFGLFAESQANVPSLGSDGRFFQEDALNDDQGNVQPMHRVRVFPLRSRSGDAVANSFLLACEEASNSDYQDYVFVISNVTPAPDFTP
jgi:hypothetical protein